MLKVVARTIRQYNMLSPGDGVVVGLSGGADSVTLLSVLLGLKNELQLKIYAAHINHNLRGRAARKDERLAQLLCERLGVPFFVFHADVWGFARENKMGTEEAGRKLRYQYLAQCMEECRAQKIAVGHSQEDNAETILLNLFRGAGLKGLCGILPVNGRIIRPLLEVSRKNIEAYVKENRLPFAKDKTNLSSNYSRNYIRNEITPKIRKYFGDKVSYVIANNALLLRADEEALITIAKDSYRDGKLQPAAGDTVQITLCIKTLLSHPIAITRRIIREAINNLRGEAGLTDITSAHIQAIIDIAQGRTGREASLPGCNARREYGSLVLSTPSNAPQPGYCHTLLPHHPVHIPPLTITLTLHPPENLPPAHYTHSFNYDKVNTSLELRTRRPGDKITLPGGTKKLQDYFTDRKTPRIQRDTVPLIADGSNILWILDKHSPVSAAYRPQEGQATCWIIAQ